MKNFFKKGILGLIVVTILIPTASFAQYPQPQPGTSVSTASDGTINIKAQAPKNTELSPDCSVFSSTFFGCASAVGSSFILGLAAKLLYYAGTFFDYMLDISLNMAKLMERYPIVTIGWGVLRDVTNIIYIFLLLFVAINMILGNATYGNKSLIAQIIVTALLVNFSLFATKVVIDATNIAALQFYNLMMPKEAGAKNDSITGHFMQVLSLQKIYAVGNNDTTLSTDEGQSTATQVRRELVAQSGLNYEDTNTFWFKVAAVCILGTFFVLAVSVVFFAGAFLFVSRTVVLFFVMLFSSLAFASRALPSTKGQFNKWLKMLIDNAIFAPIFLALLYLLVRIFSSNTTQPINFARIILAGDGLGGLFSFFMIMAFLVGILLIAKTLGVKGGDFAHAQMEKRFGTKALLGYGKNIAQGTATRTLGRAATAVAESSTMRNIARYVPGIAKPLSKVGAATGYNAVKESRKESDKFISGVSSQGQFETDDAYKVRSENARKRGLSNLGLDAKGNVKTGVIATPINVARKLLSGKGYSDAQRAAAKKAKSDATNKERTAAKNLNIAREISDVTGLPLVKQEPGKEPEDDDKTIQKVYKLIAAEDFDMGTGHGLLLNKGEVAKGEAAIEIGSGTDLGSAYFDYRNATDGTPEKVAYNKEFRRQLALLKKTMKPYIDSKEKAADKADSDSKKDDKK